MNIYEYFLFKDNFFIPRTPSYALAGVKKGLIKSDVFINISLFLYKPLVAQGKLENLSAHEEIQRLNELERILAKQNINLDTELLLITTLEKLVEHINPEIALFAAESINTIENRYNKRIFELKSILENKTVVKDILELFYIYFKYGYINSNKSDIQNFYYLEALKYLQLLPSRDFISYEFQHINIIILNNLKMYEEARSILELFSHKLLPWQKNVLAAEIEFESKNFFRIPDILSSIDISTYPDNIKDRVSIWI